MSHVFQLAEFSSLNAAKSAEAELRDFMKRYAKFEEEDPNPWADDRVAPPLAALGARFGFDWPCSEDSRVLLRGMFADAAHLVRIGGVVLLFGEGFELGGASMRRVLTALGATRTDDRCDVVVKTEEPARARDALVASLLSQDFEDTFELGDHRDAVFHSIGFESESQRAYLNFLDTAIADFAAAHALLELAE